jgi:hypothetical protein
MQASMKYETLNAVMTQKISLICSFCFVSKVGKCFNLHFADLRKIYRSFCVMKFLRAVNKGFKWQEPENSHLKFPMMNDGMQKVNRGKSWGIAFWQIDKKNFPPMMIRRLWFNIVSQLEELSDSWNIFIC